MKTKQMMALLAIVALTDVALAQEASFKVGGSTKSGVAGEGEATAPETEKPQAAEAKPEKPEPKVEAKASAEAPQAPTPTADASAEEASAADATAPDVKADEPEPTPESEPTPAKIPYIKRYVPEVALWEVGLFGGLFVANDNHELYEPGLSAQQQGYKPAFQVGVRAGFFPTTEFGLEVEAAGMSSGTKEDDSPAGFGSLRGYLIFQLPGHSVVPFASVGGGFIAAASSPMNDDIDPAFAPGLGIKVAVDEYLSLRFDVRDVMTQKFQASQGSLTHSPEVLLGLTLTPNRRLPDSDGDGVADHKDACPHVSGEFGGCPAPDSDDDGVVDEADQCPEAAGNTASGCPDSDGDGVIDIEDACPDVAGETAGGCQCAPAEPDTDGDGVVDSKDECPDVAGDAPNGCRADSDGDGIVDAEDQCPQTPEVKNGYLDDDGCADEVPEEVKAFDGVMEGITFEFGSAEVKPASKPKLDETANVMKKYPSITVEISGHTDNTGDHDQNVALSQQRAESVKKYLVDAGVEADRIETVGFGPDKPVADNDTPANKAKNRRIEFHLKSR